MRIALVIGHSKASPGACSPYLGVCEYAFNDELARALVPMLRDRGHVPQPFYRDGTDIRGVARAVNAWSADVCLSLHFNSYSDPKAQGTETLFYPGSRAGRQLALYVQQHVVALLRTRDRGLRERDDLAILQATRCPAILCEPFFGSNQEDCQKLERHGERGLAHAYADGLEVWWRGTW